MYLYTIYIIKKTKEKNKRLLCNFNCKTKKKLIL